MKKLESGAAAAVEAAPAAAAVEAAPAASAAEAAPEQQEEPAQQQPAKENESSGQLLRISLTISIQIKEKNFVRFHHPLKTA